MKLKTIKTHENDYGVRDGLPYEKTNGRVYEVEDDAAAQTLIDAGYVEKSDSDRRAAKPVGE